MCMCTRLFSSALPFTRAGLVTRARYRGEARERHGAKGNVKGRPQIALTLHMRPFRHDAPGTRQGLSHTLSCVHICATTLTLAGLGHGEPGTTQLTP